MPAYKKIQVQKLSKDFREATQIVQVDEMPTPKADNVVIKNHYVGINATDINYTNGAYLPGVQPPFDCGLEGVGMADADEDDEAGAVERADDLPPDLHPGPPGPLDNSTHDPHATGA